MPAGRIISEVVRTVPIFFYHLIKFALLMLALVIIVPRAEIRRLAVYGLIFGSAYDVIGLGIGHWLDLFRWINFGPFGYGYLPFDSPISWCMFYIMYFYFLPREKPFVYIFPVAGVVMSIVYSRVLVNLGMFIEPYFALRIANFALWYTSATWGYLRLSRYMEHKNGGAGRAI